MGSPRVHSPLTRRSALSVSALALLAVVLTGLGAPAVVGCLSVPTLPLPPPSRPDDVQQVGDGRYRITGRVPPSDLVLTENVASQRVYGQASTGVYDFVVEGAPGDPMKLWYVVGEQSSEALDFTLPTLGSDAGADGAAAGDAAATRPDGSASALGDASGVIP